MEGRGLKRVSYSCCFLIKGGFLLHHSCLTVINNVPVDSVQKPQRGKMTETTETSEVHHLRLQSVSHSCLNMNSVVNQLLSLLSFLDSKRGRTEKGAVT